MSDLDAPLAALAAGFRRLKGIGEGEADTGEIAFDEWDWEVGVGLYGLLREAQARGDEGTLAAIGRWYDRQIGRGLPARQVNSTAPMLALACLADRRDDWRGLCEDWAGWPVRDLPRTREGGFEHVVKEGRRPGQLWDDTLVMAVLFLARTGVMSGRGDWIEEAHHQYLVHVRHLGDPASGLFFHGWSDAGHNYARALWGRGNAWITMAIPELFAIAPPEGAVARHLGAVLRTQVAALSRLQRADGMFHTLLDDPGSPPEASATAGIGYGVLAGIREGLLPPGARAIAERARGAILSRIGTDGILAEVSDGTAMGDTLGFYRRIPNVAAPYGQALAGLFLSEMRRAER